MSKDSESSEQLEDKQTGKKPIDKKETFPKSVGIVFIERRQANWRKWFSRKKGPALKFDQLACAHLVLQMNRVQNIFDFEIITLSFIKVCYRRPNQFYYISLAQTSQYPRLYSESIKSELK
jgi:hypothetical protein